MSEISHSIEIAVSPAKVFEAVSHLELMGQFSPENTGGRWLKGATGPAQGVKFRGTNTNGKKNWTTLATVVSCESPSQFAFEVTVGPAKVSRWEYRIEPTASGSLVSETWTDRRSSLAKRLSKSIRADREEFTRHSIQTTLAGLKSHLES